MHSLQLWWTCVTWWPLTGEKRGRGKRVSSNGLVGIPDRANRETAVPRLLDRLVQILNQESLLPTSPSRMYRLHTLQSLLMQVWERGSGAEINDILVLSSPDLETLL